MNQLRVAVIGGGSGGHLFPAISVVQEILRERPNSSVLFLTSHRQIDAQVLKSAGWPKSAESDSASGNSASVLVEPYVRIAGSSGKLLRLALLPGTSRAYLRAKSRLRVFAPHVVIGCGAMASLAGVYAAHRLRIPIVLMEQNVVPGQAIRILSRYARLTQTGLPMLPKFAEKWPTEILVTGTPVRPAILRLAGEPHEMPFGQRRPKLLILGGSQGSRTVNRLTLEALADEKLLPSDWEIVHQTGEAHVAEVSAEYARRGRMASVKSFLPDLPNQLASATIAISRAGAGTLQELACAALPSILIPLSHAANDHQLLNASLLFDQSAAAMIDETSVDAGLQLRRQIEHLVRNPTLREQLSRKIGQFARPNASREFASRIIELVESSAC
jgi:UDP-N-acetylglucosamine--N-acetylmuramyl-(pentapeptide) pyrophosphoryl-undecaprenol N-acetylglucosamine transferase